MEPPRVLSLQVRRRPGAAPEAVDRLELEAGRGVVGDHTFGGKRHVTLLFLEDWKAAAREAGSPDADPSCRRANVLLGGGGAAVWIGRRVRLGGAILFVVDETRPCALMERVAPGLLAALRSDARAGVWARVETGGVVRPGDVLEALA